MRACYIPQYDDVCDHEEATKHGLALAEGKTIDRVQLLRDDVLMISFDDGCSLHIEDRGQDCCERRYMTTDDADTFDYYVGAQFYKVETRPAMDVDESTYDDVHELQFLHVITSKGTFVCESHNEHNGYYGGFSLQAELVDPGMAE
jgi:hypothetical protein